MSAAERAKPLSPRARRVVGALFVLLGLLPILAALGVDAFAEGKNAPDWLIGMVGLLFVLGGVFIWSGDAGRDSLLASVTAMAMILGLAATANWVAFGPGLRECESSVSFLFFSNSRLAGEIECRAAFGIGALMLDAIVLISLGHFLKKCFGEALVFKGLEKLGWGLMIVALAPFLVLLVVIAFVKIGGEGLRKAVKKRFGSG